MSEEQQSFQEGRLEAADALRQEMEALGASVRDLVVRQPPVQLLGYLLAQFQMVMMLNPGGSESEPRPNKDAIKAFQFALEYVHAVWSSNASLPPEDTAFDENLAGELLNTLAQLEEKTMWYCIASARTRTELHAKTTWAFIRGHRYQVLEDEFFRFVLAPHDAALREAYGMGSEEIASGIQNISDAFRAGFSNAVNKIEEHMDETHRMAEETGGTLENVLKQLHEENSPIISDMSGNVRDMLFGGVCNLSRHSGLPRPLLEDLSYEPGQNDKFFADGAFSGTPMRALPARIKPGIRLGDDFYATDGQFIRDSAYRALQWGLWKRLPAQPGLQVVQRVQRDGAQIVDLRGGAAAGDLAQPRDRDGGERSLAQQAHLFGLCVPDIVGIAVRRRGKEAARRPPSSLTVIAASLPSPDACGARPGRRPARQVRWR